MPNHEHLVLCGGVERSPTGRVRNLKLDLHGRSANVRLRISDISRRLIANIPDVLTDLLEVAGYVYAADCAITRGGKSDAEMGKRWRRSIRLVIPVRLPDRWSQSSVAAALVE